MASEGRLAAIQTLNELDLRSSGPSCTAALSSLHGLRNSKPASTKTAATDRLPPPAGLIAGGRLFRRLRRLRIRPGQDPVGRTLNLCCLMSPPTPTGCGNHASGLVRLPVLGSEDACPRGASIKPATAPFSILGSCQPEIVRPTSPSACALPAPILGANYIAQHLRVSE